MTLHVYFTLNINKSFQVTAADLQTSAGQHAKGSNIVTLLPPAHFAGHHITQVMEVKSAAYSKHTPQH